MSAKKRSKIDGGGFGCVKCKGTFSPMYADAQVHEIIVPQGGVAHNAKEKERRGPGALKSIKKQGFNSTSVEVSSSMQKILSSIGVETRE